MSPILPEVCHRTRQHVSLRLDTELSELEEALLTAHLRRCAACSAFAVDLQVVTETLRAAPLAEPSVRFQLPRRPARLSVAFASSAAAAAITVAMAVGGIAISGVVGVDSSGSRISASDVQQAHDRMILNERLTEAMEVTTGQRSRQVPRGFRAAKDATLDPTLGG